MSEEQPDTGGQESWRPARETKAQREWQPGQQKKQRSIMVMFTSTVLLGEAFVIAFFGLMLYGMNQDDGGLWMLLGSLALAVFAAALAGLVKKRIVIALGWILIILMIASGFREPFGFIVGIAIVVAWLYAVAKGQQIDRENRASAKAEEALQRQRDEEPNNN